MPMATTGQAGDICWAQASLIPDYGEQYACVFEV